MLGWYCNEEEWEFRIAMEFMEEGDLSKLIGNHPTGLHPSIACKLAGDVMKGLCFLHKRNIIHRDLKPSNILLTRTTHSDSSSPSTLTAKIAGSFPSSLRSIRPINDC